MDIKKQKKNTFFVKYRVPIGVVIGISIIFGFIFLQPDFDHKIERSQLSIGTVKRGNLDIVIDGYGKLRSNEQRLIAAYSAATIKEILLRPGAKVSADSVILRLDNPELLQQIETSQMNLSRERAAMRRLKLSNERELLSERSALHALKAQLARVKLRVEAQSTLVKSGIISAIAFKELQLEEKQILEQLDIFADSIAQLEKVHVEALNISNEEINQANSHLERLYQRRSDLTVRAGIEGTLQRVSVELGQSVIAGQEIALVGSNSGLVAFVRVSQAFADQMQIGQEATINTRSEQVAGVVTRVAPEISDGTIEVEVAFKDGIPSSARPELNVDAKIYASKLKNVLMIERPTNVQSNAQIKMFHLSSDDTAQATQVRFGKGSGRFIQILSGAKEQQRFILSDLSRFRDAENIRIIY